MNLLRRYRDWLKNREIDDVVSLAGAHIALCIAYGDHKRADRLREVIAALEAGRP